MLIDVFPVLFCFSNIMGELEREGVQMFWKKKNKMFYILDYMNVPLKDADRIAGGITRIEMESKTWSDLVTRSLKLAENDEQECLVWYFIGFRSGILCDRMVRNMMFPIPKQHDPAIQ